MNALGEATMSSGRVKSSAHTGDGVREIIRDLASAASFEMSAHDLDELDAVRERCPSSRIYVSHLPGQSWATTIETCIAVQAIGCEPVPHLPVRYLQDRRQLDEFLDQCVGKAGVQELLIVAGDHAIPAGPYTCALDVIRAGVLRQFGIRRISVAGHPEGHPKISAQELNKAEDEKIQAALSDGLRLTFLTQFFFEAAPFIAWRRRLKIDSRQIRVVAGLAGPASLAKLVRFAVKCGVGHSLKSLTENPRSLTALLGQRGREDLVLALARAQAELESGLHFFSFGGLTRTCAWLSAMRQGRFTIEGESLSVRDRE